MYVSPSERILEVVVADMAATSPLLPTFAADNEAPVLDDGVAYSALWPDGSGFTFYISIDGTYAERLAALARDLQAELHVALWGAGLSPVWPPCPLHPSQHPLVALSRQSVAWWNCAPTKRDLVPIGHLAAL
jgi:hypothetical protein